MIHAVGTPSITTPMATNTDSIKEFRAYLPSNVSKRCDHASDAPVITKLITTKIGKATHSAAMTVVKSNLLGRLNGQRTDC